MGSASRAAADPRVLVVEDEPLIAFSVEEMLARMGCLVIGPAEPPTLLLVPEPLERCSGSCFEGSPRPAGTPRREISRLSAPRVFAGSGFPASSALDGAPRRDLQEPRHKWFRCPSWRCGTSHRE